MTRVSQGDFIPRVLRQPKNGIPGYENASDAEQMVLFSRLIETDGGRAVKKLWPKLDPIARSFVMEKLGCFTGPGSSQKLYLTRYEERRAMRTEIGRQIRTVKKYIKAMEESVRSWGNCLMRLSVTSS